ATALPRPQHLATPALIRALRRGVPCSIAFRSWWIRMPADAPLTLSLRRFSALLVALRDGPLNRHALLDRLGDAYPRTASARPMVDHGVKRLAELEIVIAISHTRPLIYTLHGGAPTFDAADLR